MKRILLSTIVFFAVFSSFAQSSADRRLSSFNEVTAQEGIDVILKAGTSESAHIEASGIAIEDVLTEVQGNTLKIHLEGDNHRNIDVKVTVTYVTLSALKASSAASVRAMDAITTKGDFQIECSSAGAIEAKVTADKMMVNVSSSGKVVVKVNITSLEANVSSAGDLDIQGAVKKADVNASSSGDFDGFDLTSDQADLRGSSGASIKITVNEDLKARASSGANIRYQGTPRNTDSGSSSGGSVKRY